MRKTLSTRSWLFLRGSLPPLKKTSEFSHTTKTFFQKKQPAFYYEDVNEQKSIRKFPGFTDGNKIDFYHFGNDVILLPWCKTM